MDKHKKTLVERSEQKKFHSEFHRLLDTKYIIHHLEFVEFKGTFEYKRMDEKTQNFHTDRWKEQLDRYKTELENYEKNREIDEDLHKALDGLYCTEKLSAAYASRLMYILAFDWNEPSIFESAKQAYKDRKKYK